MAIVLANIALLSSLLSKGRCTTLRHVFRIVQSRKKKWLCRFWVAEDLHNFLLQIVTRQCSTYIINKLSRKTGTGIVIKQIINFDYCVDLALSTSLTRKVSKECLSKWKFVRDFTLMKPVCRRRLGGHIENCILKSSSFQLTF